MKCGVYECMACGLLFFESETLHRPLSWGDVTDECPKCESEDIFPIRLIYCTNCGMTSVQTTFFHEEINSDEEPKYGICKGFYHEWDKDCEWRDDNKPPVCNSYKWEMISWTEFLGRHDASPRLIRCKECGMVATQDCFFPNHLSRKCAPVHELFNHRSFDPVEKTKHRVHRWRDKKGRQRGCGSNLWELMDLSSLYESLRRKGYIG